MSKVSYDMTADVVYIRLSDEAIAESDSQKEGVVLDYSADGKVVGIEILNASKNLPHPSKWEYEVVGKK